MNASLHGSHTNDICIKAGIEVCPRDAILPRENKMRLHTRWWSAWHIQYSYSLLFSSIFPFPSLSLLLFPSGSVNENLDAPVFIFLYPTFFRRSQRGCPHYLSMLFRLFSRTLDFFSAMRVLKRSLFIMTTVTAYAQRISRQIKFIVQYRVLPYAWGAILLWIWYSFICAISLSF